MMRTAHKKQPSTSTKGTAVSAERRIKKLAKKEHLKRKRILRIAQFNAEREKLTRKSKAFIIEELAMDKEFKHLKKQLVADGASKFSAKLYLGKYQSRQTLSDYETIRFGAKKAHESFVNACLQYSKKA